MSTKRILNLVFILALALGMAAPAAAGGGNVLYLPVASSSAPAVAPAEAVARTPQQAQQVGALSQTMVSLTSRGSSQLGGPASAVIQSEIGQPLSQSIQRSIEKEIPRGQGVMNVPARKIPGIPAVAGNPVTQDNPGFSGFNGVSHFDQRFAGTGDYANTQFSLEPPDQGLCVGNGFVVEPVNLAMSIYDKQGNLLAGPTALNQFFKLAPEIVRPNGPFGDFTSDPKCYYDAPTGRWFLTMLQIDVDPATGNLAKRSHTEIAVSKTNDPTGEWFLYSIDTTNDGLNGTPAHAGCELGCLGDQPLIGADAYGFYISTNEFPTFVNGFNGAQIYAMSKTGLEAGSLPPVVLFDNLPLAESLAYSVQPATSPASQYELGQGGTEYFLSALQFSGLLDNRLAVWALTNTASLNTATPNVTLRNGVFISEVYGQPPAADQQSGLTPLRTCLAVGCAGIKSAEPIAQIETNDDRMNQTVFAGGLLYSGVNTILSVSNQVQAGIAFFAVKPMWVGGNLVGSPQRQGYVAVKGNNVMFPSIGVNTSGQGVMVFSLAGPNYYPSTAYLKLGDPAGNIHIAGMGAGPQDGFTGYAVFTGVHTARWGDYSAAVADGDAIWMAAEYIPGSCSCRRRPVRSRCCPTRRRCRRSGARRRGP
ncbi:MAG TPA: hypothetical protein VF498_10745, partial [Anaerolineales bacterium]